MKSGNKKTKSGRWGKQADSVSVARAAVWDTSLLCLYALQSTAWTKHVELKSQGKNRYHLQALCGKAGCNHSLTTQMEQIGSKQSSIYWFIYHHIIFSLINHISSICHIRSVVLMTEMEKNTGGGLWLLAARALIWALWMYIERTGISCSGG